MSYIPFWSGINFGIIAKGKIAKGKIARGKKTFENSERQPQPRHAVAASAVADKGAALSPAPVGCPTSG